MKTYKIVIEFEVAEEVLPKHMNELAYQCCVQLESLDDGTLQDSFGQPMKYEWRQSSYKWEKVDGEAK